jgi:pimeloyl-ACP methyl ester carboxylesterase
MFSYFVYVVTFVLQRNFVKIIIPLFVVFLCGCSTGHIEYVGRKARTETMVTTVLTGKSLSYKTRQYLVSNALAAEYETNPKKVIKLLADFIENPDDSVRLNNDGIRFTLYVLMELCIFHAENSTEKEALKYWMSACFYSYKYIFDKSISPPLNQYYTMLGRVMALHFYNISLTEIADYLIKNNELWEKKPVFDTVMGKVEFTNLKADLLWSPKLFKKYLIAFDYLPENFLVHSFNTGIGVPLIGIKNEKSKYRNDKELTLLNRSYPFIFVLKFQRTNFKNGAIQAIPLLFDAHKNEFFILKEKKVPLYKDYSVLLGKSLEKRNDIQGIKYMFDPGKMGDLQELYLIAPYDPNKIPVVLVHGLMSEPRTWVNALNVFFGNRTIRSNYQFLFYSYPTGLPAIISAAKFRKYLIEFRNKYDPDGNNSKMNSMVLIGHSMGGLLTRLAVQDSNGHYLVNKFLGEDIEKTKLTESQKRLLESFLIFNELPFVRRVILIAVPHRGAEMATYFYSKIGSYFTSLPASLTQESLNILNGVDKSKMSKDFIELGIPTGIDDLSPDRGMKKYTVDLPYGKNVVLYSILGDKNDAGKIGGSDGVVAYESAHIDNVEREVIIKSGHDEIEKPECIKEMTKILLENLDEYYRLHSDGAK